MKITLQEAESLIKEINDKIEDQQFEKNGQAFGVSLSTNGTNISIEFLGNVLVGLDDTIVNNVDDLRLVVEGNIKAMVESVSAIKI